MRQEYTYEEAPEVGALVRLLNIKPCHAWQIIYNPDTRQYTLIKEYREPEAAPSNPKENEK